MWDSRPEALWVTYSARRNRAIADALAAVLEHVALSRILAEEALAVGNRSLTAVLESEALDGERDAADLLRMLGELGHKETPGQNGRGL